jgi:putative ATP-binding cassette transporter
MDSTCLGRGQFHFLASQAPNRVFSSVIAGICGGIAYGMLIPMILLSLAPVDPVLGQFVDEKPWMLWGWQIQQPRFAAAFLVLCVFVVLARATSQIVFGNVMVTAGRNLRLLFAERIRRLPIRSLEALGPTRLMSAVTLDVTRLLEAAANIPLLLTHVSTILCALAFIAFLHVKVFLTVVVVMAIGIVTYRLPVVLGQRHFAAAREHRDGVQESFRGQVHGAKQLKLNAAEYRDFMSRGMQQDEAAISRNLNRGNVIFYLAVQYGNVVGFFAIGVITYCSASLYALPTQLLVSIVMAMLYILGPISVIVNAFPALAQGTVALAKLNELLRDMPVEALDESAPQLACRELRLERVTFSYPGSDAFTVGPVSLALRRGQITFVVGGNGSGKSTLAKLLTCHYVPTSGRVLYDGEPLTEANLFGARQSVAAIYPDFYLFTHLFGHDAAKLGAAGDYLRKLALAHKVSIVEGRFSTTDLSDGQRKRLALLAAFLEDRNLYLFDEWAADQDPEFKHVFYLELLPELRRLDKIVVVISHDDRYFEQADQLVWMEHGKLQRLEQRQPRRACDEVRTAGG